MLRAFWIVLHSHIGLNQIHDELMGHVNQYRVMDLGHAKTKIFRGSLRLSLYRIAMLPENLEAWKRFSAKWHLKYNHIVLNIAGINIAHLTIQNHRSKMPTSDWSSRYGSHRFSNGDRNPEEY